MDEEPEAQGPYAAPVQVTEAAMEKPGFISPLAGSAGWPQDPDSQRAVVGSHELQQSPWHYGLGSGVCREGDEAGEFR